MAVRRIATPEQQRQWAAAWGMDLQDAEDAQCVDWYGDILLNFSMYVRVAIFRFTIDRVKGMMLAQSTPESNRVGQYNSGRVGTTTPLRRLEWEEYHLYWYPGVQWMDWRAFASPNHVYLGCLGDWLRPKVVQYDQRKLQGRLTSDGLRILLASLGVTLVLLGELGYSTLEYCGLDLVFQLLQPEDAYEEWGTWYYGSQRVWPPKRRAPLDPRDWYTVTNWTNVYPKHSWGEDDVSLGLRVTAAYDQLVRGMGALQLLQGEQRYGVSMSVQEMIGAAGLAQRMARMEARRRGQAVPQGRSIDDKPRL